MSQFVRVVQRLRDEQIAIDRNGQHIENTCEPQQHVEPVEEAPERQMLKALFSDGRRAISSHEKRVDTHGLCDEADEEVTSGQTQEEHIPGTSEAPGEQKG